MLRYYRFHSDIPHPQAAKAAYARRGPGSGWPEHCPPIRAANSFGWDVINPFEMKFTRDADGNWDIAEATEVRSDVEFDDGLTPEPQLNAWFWEKGQQRPHVITDNVYAAIRHQCKISTFLYITADEGWMVWMRDIPNFPRPWRVMESIVEVDWYRPAHPWHTVIELPRIEESDVAEVVIGAGEPLVRLVPIQRGDYDLAEMDGPAFGELFETGQQWLAAHGRDEKQGEMDITGAYARQQELSTFTVTPDQPVSE